MRYSNKRQLQGMAAHAMMSTDKYIQECLNIATEGITEQDYVKAAIAMTAAFDEIAEAHNSMCHAAYIVDSLMDDARFTHLVDQKMEPIKERLNAKRRTHS